MITYNNIYEKICSWDNLLLAFRKARKRKSKKFYVLEFEKNLKENLRSLQKSLVEQTYQPKPLKGFIIRDPKTRSIHASAFLDRIVHHSIVNILEPIFEKIFIYDSYASRKDKGAHWAVERLKDFMRKVSINGKLVKNALNNNMVQGYVLKADIKHYFQEVNHKILIDIIKKKVADEKTIALITRVLDNFEGKERCKGMPLGNLTSQFFANVYLNELDYFVKHELKAKYYIRYVDDFVLLHKNKKRLDYFKRRIGKFLNQKLKIELHPEKSKILPLRNGSAFLGYRIFYNYSLLSKRNINNILNKLLLFKKDMIRKEDFHNSLVGWEGYAKWANSYNLRSEIVEAYSSTNC
ncbi:MAG TPA: reverse transcriptase domain-containing protein [Candidatus Nanoarchaeia archaeon]|nr:reverse transcriptase domain-containing protein [Candidatus Nanoarchaeia archaeon]